MRRRPRLLAFLPLTVVGLRRLRIDPAATAVMVAVVFLTAAGVAAAPHYLRGASDQILQSVAQSSNPQQRNVGITRTGRIAADGETSFRGVDEQGIAYYDTFGETLQSTIGTSSFVVSSPNFQVRSLPFDPSIDLNQNRFFIFRAQSEIESRMEVEEGRPPQPAPATTISVRSCDPEQRQTGDDPCSLIGLPLLAPDQATIVGGSLPADDETVTVAFDSCADVQWPDEGECADLEIPVFETALTEATASALGLGVGDRALINPVIDTGLNSGLPLAQIDYIFVLQVSGLISLSPPNEEFWFGDPQLHAPNLIPSGFSGFQVFAAGVMSSRDYDRLVSATLPSRFIYSWRYFLDYGLVDSTNIDDIASEVQTLDLVYPPPRSFGEPNLQTGIDDIAADHADQRRTSIALSSLAIVGLAGLVLGVTVVLAALAARRREATTILIRSRGSYPLRQIVARFTEALVLFVPASLAGVAVVAILGAKEEAAAPLWGWSVLIALSFASLFVLLSTPYITGHLGRLLAGRPIEASKTRRLVIEVTVLVLGLGSILLLERRGVQPDNVAFDPLLAASPLLAGMAAGVILLRVVPALARLMSQLASRGRGLVGMIGLRSIVGRTVPARLPSVVLLIAVALSVFGSLLMESVAAAQFEGSFQTVGANYRLEPTVQGAALSPELDISDVDAVEATADASFLAAQVEVQGFPRGNLSLLAIDLDEYQTVTGGTPADAQFQPSMLRPIPDEDRGTESNPLPVVISRDWPQATPVAGEMLTLFVQQRRITVVVDQVRESFPGLSSTPFVVVSRADLGAAHGRLDVSPTRRYVKAPDSASAQLDEVTQQQQRGARLLSRPQMLTDLRSSPTVITVGEVYRLSLWLATALAAMAVVAGFALTSADRTRDLGYLRAVGLAPGQMTALTVTEQLPPALAATAFGLVVGFAVALTAIPNMDLLTLTATDLGVGLTVSGSSVTIVCLLLLGTVMVATAIYSRASRILDLSQVLRRGDRT